MCSSDLPVELVELLRGHARLLISQSRLLRSGQIRLTRRESCGLIELLSLHPCLLISEVSLHLGAQICLPCLKPLTLRSVELTGARLVRLRKSLCRKVLVSQILVQLCILLCQSSSSTAIGFLSRGLTPKLVLLLRKLAIGKGLLRGESRFNIGVHVLLRRARGKIGRAHV